MAKKTDYIVGDFVFATKADYERAQKEQETITYLVANTDMSDMKAVLKVYNRAVEKKSFQTVIGLEFMKGLRTKLVGSGILEEKLVSPVPIQRLGGVSKGYTTGDEKDAMIKRYRIAYEDAVAGRKIRNMAIIFLVLILVAVLAITIKTRYSVFTYFTDYKSNMENELIDQYEQWQKDLEEREAAVEEREQQLGIEKGQE